MHTQRESKKRKKRKGKQARNQTWCARLELRHGGGWEQPLLHSEIQGETLNQRNTAENAKQDLNAHVLAERVHPRRTPNKQIQIEIKTRAEGVP